MDCGDRHDAEMAAVRYDTDRLNGTMATIKSDVDRLRTMVPPDLGPKINDVKVRHDRLERHAVDHWGYRF